MNVRWKRAMGALAAAGVFAGLGAGTATAQPSAAASRTYHIYNNLYGIPKSVKAGTSFYADTWYMQDSPVRISALQYGMGIWSRVAGTDRGITVSWLNPVTHRWQPSTGTWAQGAEFALPMASPYGVVMLPHHWYKIQFKITVGKSVRAGTWHISEGVDGIMGPNGTQAPTMEFLGSQDRQVRVHH